MIFTSVDRAATAPLLSCNMNFRIDHQRLIVKAIAISVILNVIMVASAFTAQSSNFTRFANALAAPPGIIIARVFAPGQHTMPAFAASALEALFFPSFFMLSLHGEF